MIEEAKIYKIGSIVLMISLVAAMTSGCWAQCTTCAKGTEDWIKTAQSFLNGNLTEQNQSSSSPAQQYRLNNQAQGSAAESPERSAIFEEMLAPLSSIYSYDIILDVSPEVTEYIEGAISIPYTKFLRNGSLKPASEIAKILGDAGISSKDSIVVYGKCLPCEGKPLTATFGYWVLKYLGHQQVKMLDGGIDEWVALKMPTVTSPETRSKTDYAYSLNPEILATYDYVKNGGAQVVDARSFQEYGLGYIPKSRPIPYEKVLSGGRIKEEAELRELFTVLSKNRPVIVYTDTVAKASMVWFALELLGYDGRLYSWKDWLENQPKLNIDLGELHAEPNPARIGSAIRITAIFKEADQNASASSAWEGDDSNASNRTILSIKGCATCGFGSPQGFANINSSGGVVKLGSYGKSGSNYQADGFKAAAVIRDPLGSEIDRVNLKRISGDQYLGIWNANVAPGIYEIEVVASALGSTKIFDKNLQIKVIAAR